MVKRSACSVIPDLIDLKEHGNESGVALTKNIVVEGYFVLLKSN